METQQGSHIARTHSSTIAEEGLAISSRLKELSPDIFLAGAAGSVALSLLLRLTGRDHDAHFVGQWAPTLLLVGLYRKIGWGAPGRQRLIEGGQVSSAPEVH
jgi:hypothetical protein